MPPWARSSGGLRRDVVGIGGSGGSLRRVRTPVMEELNGVARFQVLDSDYEDDEGNEGEDSTGEEIRRARMALVGQRDLSGYNRTNSVRGGTAATATTRSYLDYEDLAYGEDYSEKETQLQLLQQRESDIQLAMRAKEDAIVEIALERIDRAKARGDSNIDLTPSEIETLRRRGLFHVVGGLTDTAETTSSRPSSSRSRNRAGSSAKNTPVSSSKRKKSSEKKDSSPAPSRKPTNKRLSLSSIHAPQENNLTLVPYPLSSSETGTFTPPDTGSIDQGAPYRHSPRQRATTTATSSPGRNVSRRSSRAASLSQRPPSSAAAYISDPRYASEYRPPSAASMYRVLPPHEAEWRQPQAYYPHHPRPQTPPSGPLVDPFIYQVHESPSSAGRRFVSNSTMAPASGSRVVYPQSAIQYASVPRRIPVEYAANDMRGSPGQRGGIVRPASATAVAHMVGEDEIIEISSDSEDGMASQSAKSAEVEEEEEEVSSDEDEEEHLPPRRRTSRR